MDALIELPLAEPDEITALRSTCEACDDDASAIALGMALTAAGCSHEAAFLLRPRRKLWKDTDADGAGAAALAAITWWNKSWREFAQARQAGRHTEALAMLEGREHLYWDWPPLLMHLGAMAQAAGKLDLAEHIFQRVQILAERGVEKLDTTAFNYAAPASLIDILSERGNHLAALEAYSRISSNPGNAMAHQLQGARLLALVGNDDDAMRHIAGIVATAEKERKGWSRDARLDFVDAEPALDRLRTRPDWAAMRKDPGEWLKS